MHKRSNSQLSLGFTMVGIKDKPEETDLISQARRTFQMQHSNTANS